MMHRNPHRALLLVLAAFAGGCPHQPLAGPPSRTESVYAVAVAQASGPRLVSSVYDLQVEPGPGDMWTVRTTHSTGSWEESGVAMDFDSDAPSAADPWPLRQQYAISALPTRVRLEDGRPTELLDAEQWSAEAEAALATALPEVPEAAAKEAGRALIDPAGVVRDLRRSFPGTPTSETWERPLWFAGVPATTREECTVQSAGSHRRWQCTGTAVGPDSGDKRLHEMSVESLVLTDHAGLVRYEIRWTGTLLYLDEQEQRLIRDRPVAGHRLVLRQSPEPGALPWPSED